LQNANPGADQTAIHRGQPGFDLGMADREQLKLERQQTPAAVLTHGQEELAKSLQLRLRMVKLVDKPFGVRDAVRNLALQQCQEKVFLAVEVGVEGTASVAGLGRNLLQLGGFKSVPGEDLLRRLDEASTRAFGGMWERAVSFILKMDIAVTVMVGC
jgi:hypothetical protein